jgi:uncharacterized protein YlxP (DUF503 family)
MIVGTLLIALRLPGAETLKDKRRVVRSMIEVARRRFGVSAAEVGDTGLSGNATIGIAFVSANKVQVESALAAVMEFVESHSEVEIYDFCQEIESR